jgi:hypothetical protein
MIARHRSTLKDPQKRDPRSRIHPYESSSFAPRTRLRGAKAVLAGVFSILSGTLSTPNIRLENPWSLELFLFGDKRYPYTLPSTLNCPEHDLGHGYFFNVFNNDLKTLVRTQNRIKSPGLFLIYLSFFFWWAVSIHSYRIRAWGIKLKSREDIPISNYPLLR